MIEFDDVRFQFRNSDFSLRIPSLSIEAGSVVALVGPSGSGKTTLLNLLAGILVPNQGRIRVAGTEVSSLSDSVRRNFRIASVGLVFQDFELIEYLNVRDNIVVPYLINRQLKMNGDVRRSAESIAGSMGLQKLLKRPIRKLSQGERQRVAICRALLPGPRLILADEPTGNLDPKNKQHIIDILIDQARSTKATLLVVTHDHSLLDRFDRIIDFADFLSPEQP